MRVITDGSGTAVADKHYYPYGTEVAPGGPDERQIKFTGHQRDAHGVTDYTDRPYITFTPDY